MFFANVQSFIPISQTIMNYQSSTLLWEIYIHPKKIIIIFCKLLQHLFFQTIRTFINYTFLFNKRPLILDITDLLKILLYFCCIHFLTKSVNKYV